VTWIFADGPRQSIPLDGLYSKLNGAHDIRINNWSAVRDSVTDFNNNSRNVQCGTGFAGGATNTAIGCPPNGSGTPNPNVFDHGISQGASEALDLETTWTLTVRAPQLPKPSDTTALDAGAAVFEAQCASCHGGAKWTKSEVLYLNDPALDRAFAAGGSPRDPGLELVANQSVSYADGAVDGNVLNLLEDVGTFDAASPIEIRQNGNAPLGAAGFNVPSLLGVAYHAPYFHHGSAQTLEDVFAQHDLGGGTIESTLSPDDRDNLLVFLGALDGRTAIFRSETDDFKEPLTP
jgi:mono/diheme cytochrome c family protein